MCALSSFCENSPSSGLPSAEGVATNKFASKIVTKERFTGWQRNNKNWCVKLVQKNFHHPLSLEELRRGSEGEHCRLKISDCRLEEKSSNPWKTETFSENVDERFQPRSLGELGLEPFMCRRIFHTHFVRGVEMNF